MKNRFQIFILSISMTSTVAFSQTVRVDPPPAEPLEKIDELSSSLWDWMLYDQLYPTLKVAGDRSSLYLFLGTATAASLAKQRDSYVYDKYSNNKGLSQASSEYGAVLGSGFPGIGIAATQLLFDTENGLAHSRALILTSVTHISIAAAVGRERPNKKNLSFPSGHTSSSFATAVSLAYAYGPYVGVPVIAGATFIGMSRIANNAHWLSDVVAGAGLGLFWARASALAKPGLEQVDKNNFFPVYTAVDDRRFLGVGYSTRW